MKLTSLSLHLSIVSTVVSQGAGGSTYSYEDACLQEYSMSLPGGACNFEAVVAAMKKIIDETPACKNDTSATDELRAILFQQKLTDDQLAEKIDLACHDAYFELMYGDGINYGDILADSHQQVKEYFDGRGCINTNREIARTTGLTDEILTTFPIQWPGDTSLGYDKAIPKEVSSQFPRNHWEKQNKRPESIDYYGTKTFGASKMGRKEVIEENYFPAENFDQCTLNTAMCCWTESGDASLVYGPPVSRNASHHNTNICYVNMADSPTSSRVKAGFAIFPEANGQKSGSGAVQCHGFSWAEDPIDVTNLFKGNTLFETSLKRHLERGGYVSAVSGAPMCACLEQMPVVTRADCTQVEVKGGGGAFQIDVEISRVTIDVAIRDDRKIEFKPCTGANATATNDLRAHYERLVAEKKVANRTEQVSQRLVGNRGCLAAVAEFLDYTRIHGYQRKLESS